jgi:SAM-dependent methyltransferase
LAGDILVIGAGQEPYRDLLSNGRSVCVTDINPGKGIDMLADAHALPFADGSFDAIVAVEVLEHLRNPVAASSELARVLRPDGVALITIPFMFRVHGDPYDFQRFTANGLEALFADNFCCRIAPMGNRIQVISDLITTAAKPLAMLRLLNHLLCIAPLRVPSLDSPSGYIVELTKTSPQSGAQ